MNTSKDEPESGDSQSQSQSLLPPKTPRKKRPQNAAASSTPSKRNRVTPRTRVEPFTDAECDILAADMVKYKDTLENAESTYKQKQEVYKHMVRRLQP